MPSCNSPMKVLPMKKISSLFLLAGLAAGAQAQTDSVATPVNDKLKEGAPSAPAAPPDAASELPVGKRSGLSLELGASVGLGLPMGGGSATASDDMEKVEAQAQDAVENGADVKMTAVAFLNEKGIGLGLGGIYDLTGSSGDATASPLSAESTRKERFVGLIGEFRSPLGQGGKAWTYAQLGLGQASVKMTTTGKDATDGYNRVFDIEGSTIGVYGAIGVQYRILPFLSVVAEGHYIMAQLDEADVTMTDSDGFNYSTTVSYEADEGSADRLGLMVGIRAEFGKF